MVLRSAFEQEPFSTALPLAVIILFIPHLVLLSFYFIFSQSLFLFVSIFIYISSSFFIIIFFINCLRPVFLIFFSFFDPFLSLLSVWIFLQCCLLYVDFFSPLFFVQIHSWSAQKLKKRVWSRKKTWLDLLDIVISSWFKPLLYIVFTIIQDLNVWITRQEVEIRLNFFREWLGERKNCHLFNGIQLKNENGKGMFSK